MVNALAILGALSLAWVIYSWVASEAIDIPPEQLSTSRMEPVPDVAVTLAANLDAPLLHGNRAQLLVNGTQIFPAMLSSIRGARESINLLSYVFWKGDVSIAFANELSAAAKRGVEVRVLLDAYGARKMKLELMEQMKQAGCKFAWYRPLRWHNLRRYNNRTHRKVLVVDGRTGFTGGVGIASEWTGNAQDPAHWRDDHFLLEGPVVRYLQGSFAENWRQATGVVLAGESMFPVLTHVGDARMVPLSAAPGGSISDIAFVYWLLFHAATQEVRIATPYFVPDPDLELGIADAARRGVKITLLVPGQHQDSAIVRYASRTYYRRLLEAGVRIFEYQPTMMHTKTVTVDNQWAVIGSSNFDSRSFELNYEIAIAAYDTSLVEALKVSYAEDLQAAREITLEEVNEWSLFARARNHLALLLREQL